MPVIVGWIEASQKICPSRTSECDLIWDKGFFANVIKIRSLRPSCIKVGLKCNDKFPEKRQKRGHRPREEGLWEDWGGN